MPNIVNLYVRGLWVWSFTLLFTYLKMTGQSNISWIVVIAPALIRLTYFQVLSIIRSYVSVKNPEEVPQEEHQRGTGFYA